MSKRRRRAREKQLRHGLAASTGLAVAATLVSGSVAQAASALYVDTTSDDSLTACTAAADDCSLRGAITRAENDAGSTIYFASDVTGTITLASDLPQLTAGETIQGPGAGLVTIDGAGQHLPFYVNTTGGPVSLSGLTVTHGSGISAGAIYAVGNQQFTVSNMAISNNTAANHGGIASYSPTVIEGSTISGNNTTSATPALYRGAIYAGAQVLTLRNSTVSGNPQGGLYFFGGTTTIENSTVVANGSIGVRWGNGDLILESTIVAGNTGEDAKSSSGTLTENFSLIQNTTGFPAPGPGSGANLNGSDPKLGALAGNGGPTDTMKPAFGSPVIDKGKDFTGTATDQRGVALFDGATANPSGGDGRDIGAVETGPPAVTAISPDHGSAGTAVTITGTDFTGATAVKFGATDATTFIVLDDAHITAVAPAGSRVQVDVRVTAPFGTSATLAADKFTYPGTFEVDTTSDDGMLAACTPAADDCSLRGAIDGANQVPGSTITFASDVSGITLASNLPALSAAETVRGPGARMVTIDGAGQHYGLIANTNHGPVSVSGLTITGGKAVLGGGITSYGTARLSLSEMVVSGNTADYGAGVYSSSPLTIDSSTVSDNESGDASVGARAGLTMRNSTVSGSSQRGVSVYSDSDATIQNSTISANGAAGVSWAAGDLTLEGTIVAGNAGADVEVIGGGTLTENFSLIQNTTVTPVTGAHNLNGENPQLGALADNGGPTQTAKPADNSPVIDKGIDSAGSGRDQRGLTLTDKPGVANPDGGDGRDIGAYEIAPPTVTSISPDHGNAGEAVTITGTNFLIWPPMEVKFGSRPSESFTVVDDTHITAEAPLGSGVVDVTVTEPDGTSATNSGAKFTYPDPGTFEVDTTLDDGGLAACTPSAGDCSLRGAITKAEVRPNSTITFASTVSGRITLASDLPSLTTGEKIVGPGANVLAIDGNHQFYGLQAGTYYGPVSVSGLTVTGGSGSYGGGISVGGNSLFSLSHMVVTGNDIAGVSSAAPLAVDDSTISGNTVTSGDGAAVLTGGTLTMRNSTVAGNSKEGVHLSDSDATIENSTIAANGAAGIAGSAGTVKVESTIVAGNTGADVTLTGPATLTEKFSLIQNTTGLPALESGSGSNLNGQDPLLTALADNGGPSMTMKPSIAGPVIDAGKDFAGTGKDQRGVPVADSSVANAADGRDIGAVESAPPQVTSLSPATALAGTSITVTGRNFTGATAVKFGGADASSFSVVDGAHITAVAPAGSGTVDVTVTGPDGTGATNAGDQFTYQPAPPPPPTQATDAAILKLLKRGAFSAKFVPKKKTLVFKDRLPEAGKATYTLKVARKKKRLSLGKASSTVTKAGTVKITIKLGKKGWTTLRHNPKGKLALLTTFKRKLNSHSLKTTRTIKPKKRPKR